MEPIQMVSFIPYNKCLECGGRVVIVETETNILELDKTGLAISTENIAMDNKLRCCDCGRVSDVNIISMRYIEKNNVVPVIRRKNNPFGLDKKD